MAADALAIGGRPAGDGAFHETTFRAMGSDVHVVVVDGPPDAPALARARIAELEDAWSRFRPDSEISRMNAAAGAWTRVSADTFLLLDCAVEGWRQTGGAFDPTVLDALRAAGYDRSFDLLADDAPPSSDPSEPSGASPSGRAPSPAGPSPGLAGLQVIGSRARLPAGTSFDPGGIGKGLAADLVAGDLMAAGSAGALVNLGGDIRVVGAGPDGDGWWIELAPLGTPVDVVGLAEGAIATSTVTRRVWRQAGEARHHLIDPTAGAPATGTPLAATVVAGEGWLAEVLTKALLLVAPDRARAILRQADATGLIVGRDGRLVTFDGMAAYLTPHTEESV